MWYGLVMFILIFGLPFGIISAVVGRVTHAYLERKRSYLSPELVDRYSLIAMLGTATVLMVGFTIGLNIMT